MPDSHTTAALLQQAAYRDSHCVHPRRQTIGHELQIHPACCCCCIAESDSARSARQPPTPDSPSLSIHLSALYAW
jgi:hypothetical protein